jgi:predicted lipoprotein with Yx(FWY)xxD motif
MKIRLGLIVVAASVGLVALAGCSGTSGGSPGATTGATTPPAASASTDLATATSSLGTIVVDGKGMTVYVFDKDTANSGKSACAGACVGQWPAVTTTSAKPSVTGVTGAVATITGANGAKQVTLNGLPLYTFAGDSAAGDVTGQGVGKIWWVVAADGTKITSSAGGY